MVVKVMTLNIAGFQSNWERRKRLIAQLLRQEHPDIVGLQEVCLLPSMPLVGQHQAAELARLAGFPFWHFAPADRRPHRAIGQAVLSRYPIMAVDLLPFPRDPNDPKDTEDRLAMWVRIGMGRCVEFCVTHLSLSPRARERSVRQLAEWLQRFGSAPKIVVGDLNDVPSSLPLQFLLRNAQPPFADAWQLFKGNEGGFTFPSHAPRLRIDYVLFTPPEAFVVEDVRLVGDVATVDGLRPSDHLGVVATLRLRAT